MSDDRRNAVNAFKKIRPNGCVEWECPENKGKCTEIRVSGWAATKVHYEFISNRENVLFVECHLVDKKLLKVENAFRQISKDYPEIKGYPLTFAPKRAEPIRSRPTLFIKLAVGVNGEEAAQVMLELIQKSRARISAALGITEPISGYASLKQPPEDYTPTKADVDLAASQIPLGVRGNIDAILDQIAVNGLVSGNILKDNWRRITEDKIAEWFK